MARSAWRRLDRRPRRRYCGRGVTRSRAGKQSEPTLIDRAVASADSSRGGGVAPAAGWLTAALVVIQICAWTLLAARFEGSIDADVAEGVVDGPEWRLSYLRHPPLSTWLSGVASTTGPWRYFVLFAIALAFGCGAFALVSLFIRRVDGRAAGFVALLAGLGSPYATYWPLKFNHNIGVMPFWALVLWTAWNAFEGGTLASWALFGAAVGFGLWAKYAILHLVAPLGLAFLLVPQWRKRLAGPGPWLAAAIAVAIIAPQAIDVMRNGATTLKWATHTTHSGAGERLGWVALFVLDAALANAPMALIAWVACGGEQLKTAIKTMVAPATMTRLDLFLHVAAVGPVLLIVLFAPFGVRIFYHWLTALTVIFAAWWGHAAGRAGLQATPRRVWFVFAAWAAVVVAGYVGAREVWRLQSPLSSGAYPKWTARRSRRSPSATGQAIVAAPSLTSSATTARSDSRRRGRSPSIFPIGRGHWREATPATRRGSTSPMSSAVGRWW